MGPADHVTNPMPGAQVFIRAGYESPVAVVNCGDVKLECGGSLRQGHNAVASTELVGGNSVLSWASARKGV